MGLAAILRPARAPAVVPVVQFVMEGQNATFEAVAQRGSYGA
jgi:hypothetical protein